MRGPTAAGTLQDHLRRTAYLLSGACAAGLIGVALGTMGSVLPMSVIQIGWGLISVLAALHAYRLSRGKPLAVPQRDWIIPSDWIDRGDFVYAVAFGACFGVGWLTKVTYVGYHLMLGLCVLVQDPVAACVAMTLFGVLRTVPVLALPLGATMSGREFGYKAAISATNLMITSYPRLLPLQVATLVAVAILGARHFVLM